MDTAKNGQGQPNHVSVYALDMQTLAMHTEPLADAITELSDAYPTLGAFLDKIGQVTPFGALLTVGISMAFQFAENHGALSPTMRDTMPGVIPRDDLARAIVSNANNGNGEAA